MNQEKQNIALLLHEYGDYHIETISFKLSEETEIEFSSDNYMLTMDDLIKSRNQLIRTLTGRCLGLAMNLIPSEDLAISKDGELQSQRLLTEESVTKIAGSTIGSFKEKVTVSVIVIDPEREKVKRLLRTRLPYDIVGLSIGISYDSPDNVMRDRWKRMLSRILEQYIVISYMTENGVHMEIGEDLFLAVKHIEDDGLSFIELEFYTSFVHQLGRMLSDKGEIQNNILEIINQEKVASDA